MWLEQSWGLLRPLIPEPSLGDDRGATQRGLDIIEPSALTLKAFSVHGSL